MHKQLTKSGSMSRFAYLRIFGDSGLHNSGKHSLFSLPRRYTILSSAIQQEQTFELYSFADLLAELIDRF